ncbi:MAG TPA: 50S ribosomal protein L21 [Acidimicrobiia bacterium]|jgi:large subunit ribosomal protein L21|nr:50S ribosomal protein L21 [Acidimicrobiia bacterium]
MYAVIKSGGKQYRVEEGEQLAVELLGDSGEVELAPVLVVDGDRVLATPTELEAARVSARVVDEARGPKVTGFTYKPKTNNRKRWGHRQRYSLIEITGISAGGARRAPSAAKQASTEEPAKKAPATKKAPAAKKSPTTTTKKAPAKKRPPKKA